MIGRTLGTYIFRRYLAAVAAFLTGLGSLIFVVDFTQLNERAGDLPQFTLGTGLMLSAMRVPMVLIQVIPFVALFASMAMLIQLNRKYELVVARSVGLSAWQFLMPACLAALLFGSLTVAVLNPLAAWGFARADAIEVDWKTSKVRTVTALKEPWLRQTTSEGDSIIGAKNVLNDGTELDDPVILRFAKDGAIESRIDAGRAILASKEWLLSEAVITRPGQAPELHPTYSVATNFTAELVQERLQRPETIPFFELPSKIAVARALGVPGNSFAMQLHSMIALPALVTVMTLIAATVSLKFVRFGQSAVMVLGGILAGFLLYVVSVLVKAFGSSGLVPPYAAAWFPVAAAFLFGVSFLLHREDG
jgi:lipopolysaccharide export system permease protein